MHLPVQTATKNHLLTSAKHLLTVILFIAVPTWLSAQGPSMDKGRKMEAMKISFLTQKLDLSVDEAKVFWPIYNDFNKEKDALWDGYREKMISFKKTTEIDELSDTEIQAMILTDFEFKQKDLNIERKYYSRLKSNLPIKTVGKFYRAQEAFKRELLNHYRGGGPKK